MTMTKRYEATPEELSKITGAVPRSRIVYDREGIDIVRADYGPLGYLDIIPTGHGETGGTIERTPEGRFVRIGGRPALLADIDGRLRRANGAHHAQLRERLAGVDVVAR